MAHVVGVEEVSHIDCLQLSGYRDDGQPIYAYRYESAISNGLVVARFVREIDGDDIYKLITPDNLEDIVEDPDTIVTTEAVLALNLVNVQKIWIQLFAGLIEEVGRGQDQIDNFLRRAAIKKDPVDAPAGVPWEEYLPIPNPGRRNPELKAVKDAVALRKRLGWNKLGEVDY